MIFILYTLYILSPCTNPLKGIVHFEINFWYVLAYLKCIQDVGVFVSAVVSILIFLGQSILVYQSVKRAACVRKQTVFI